MLKGQPLSTSKIDKSIDKMSLQRSSESYEANKSAYNSLKSLPDELKTPKAELFTLDKNNQLASYFSPEFDTIDKKDDTLNMETRNELMNKGYNLIRKLGEGSFSKVILVKKKINKPNAQEIFYEQVSYCALKIFKKDKIIKKQNVLNEYNILKQLKHKNIMEVGNLLELPNNNEILFEMEAGNTDLFSIVFESNNTLSTSEIKNIYKQCISAVDHLHINNFVHRDIKLENFVIKSEQNNNSKTVKLTDFGFSRKFDKDDTDCLISLKERCGSDEYFPPEFIVPIHESYNSKKADIWAMGIILFALVYGSLPFDYDYENPSSRKSMYFQIASNMFTFPSKTSSEFRPLIKEILKSDPKKRPDSTKISNDPAINSKL